MPDTDLSTTVPKYVSGSATGALSLISSTFITTVAYAVNGTVPPSCTPTWNMYCEYNSLSKDCRRTISPVAKTAKYSCTIETDGSVLMYAALRKKVSSLLPLELPFWYVPRSPSVADNTGGVVKLVPSVILKV